MTEEDQQKSPIISIDDIDPSAKYEVPIKAMINSPRTIEACRRQGIDLKDLEPVTEDRVRKIIAERDKSKRAIPQVLIEIRMKHYEERRKEMFKLIRQV